MCSSQALHVTQASQQVEVCRYLVFPVAFHLLETQEKNNENPKGSRKQHRESCTVHISMYGDLTNKDNLRMKKNQKGLRCTYMANTIHLAGLDTCHLLYFTRPGTGSRYRNSVSRL